MYAGSKHLRRRPSCCRNRRWRLSSTRSQTRTRRTPTCFAHALGVRELELALEDQKVESRKLREEVYAYLELLPKPQRYVPRLQLMAIQFSEGARWPPNADADADINPPDELLRRVIRNTAQTALKVPELKDSLVHANAQLQAARTAAEQVKEAKAETRRAREKAAQSARDAWLARAQTEALQREVNRLRG